ncbi:hypothetical protein PPERSA_09640 [Pseudocohnilembus persalinus]|uniref:Uncharacterized protein n=1 Tax=Pseudocohnilembus persalinus TaxID=266149 RepID=A0A0V0QFT1_PSEPJ|nr:hypothetical protein PPERSA_09640 [Pseudocohnilembus persalinus]|eukprot:KRX01034.1 hypothetical protein PPERSA_09640 [Pseudocohnilembus persalinus]
MGQNQKNLQEVIIQPKKILNQVSFNQKMLSSQIVKSQSQTQQLNTQNKSPNNQQQMQIHEQFFYSQISQETQLYQNDIIQQGIKFNEKQQNNCSQQDDNYNQNNNNYNQNIIKTHQKSQKMMWVGKLTQSPYISFQQPYKNLFKNFLQWGERIYGLNDA